MKKNCKNGRKPFQELDGREGGEWQSRHQPSTERLSLGKRSSTLTCQIRRKSEAVAETAHKTIMGSLLVIGHERILEEVEVNRDNSQEKSHARNF